MQPYPNPTRPIRPICEDAAAFLQAPLLSNNLLESEDGVAVANGKTSATPQIESSEHRAIEPPRHT